MYLVWVGFPWGSAVADVARRTGDAVLGAEGRDRAARGIVGPLRDRETDKGINGVMSRHRRSFTVEVSPPRPPNCRRCRDAESSPMSCEITQPYKSKALISNG